MIKETIKIPHKIFSRNQTNQEHWSIKTKRKKEYKLLIRNQMTLNKFQKAKTGEKILVSIKSHRKRLLDHDNLDIKSLLDAMSEEGFIWDDAPKYIGEPLLEQVKDGSEAITIMRYRESV